MNNKPLLTILLTLSASLAACGGEAEVEVSGIGEIAVGQICTETLECVPGSMCFNEFCVGSGNLRTSLAFYEDTDLDLHLVTPTGSHIYFGNDYADGGELDVDQCIDYCGPGAHVENIVFAGSPPSGTYEVWIENYDGRAPANFSIEIAGSGLSTSFSGSVGPEAGAESQRMTFDF